MLSKDQLLFLLELLGNPASTISISRAAVCAATLAELNRQLEQFATVPAVLTTVLSSKES